MQSHKHDLQFIHFMILVTFLVTISYNRQNILTFKQSIKFIGGNTLPDTDE